MLAAEVREGGWKETLPAPLLKEGGIVGALVTELSLLVLVDPDVHVLLTFIDNAGA